MNFPETRPLLSLTGPWEVRFDPKWGAPEEIIFDSLDDWSKRPEPGIRNYSGKAVYHTTFDLPTTGSGKRIFLFSGDVKNQASVKLKGQDLGIAWFAPWRVEVPAGLLFLAESRPYSGS